MGRLIRFVALVGTGVIMVGGTQVSFAGAALKDTGACALVTRRQASRILGAKVVKTKTVHGAKTNAKGCDYLTKKRTNIKGVYLELQVLVAPLTAQLRAEFEQNSRQTPIPSLGDAAYGEGSNTVTAFVGERLVQATIFNIEGTDRQLLAAGGKGHPPRHPPADARWLNQRAGSDAPTGRWAPRAFAQQ
jgi:hypothetical protein